ncbi:MAG: glycerophosphodiester phosphodiesterase [Halioglobus sp.]|nr:glycerophosphodiester phosphodiesterase [Halioglobus sp.]
MALSKTPPIVIAHRGACGYLPEHTLAAKALAHGMGADFMEQDVVLSRDGVALVLHDIHLDSTTDVAIKFPGRARTDGRFYAIDLDLPEIRELRVHERISVNAGTSAEAVYPQRFPSRPALFQVPTLEEEITMLAGLDRSRGCRTGLYIEFKAPDWHADQGLDLPGAVLAVLDKTGYADRPEQVFLQCFNDKTLRRMHEAGQTQLPMIQLIGENDWGEDGGVDFNYLRTPPGLSRVAEYAQGIGPFLPQIYLGKSDSGAVQLSNLVTTAQEKGLLVHPYTLRQDELPPGINSFSELLDVFVQRAGVDGLFTDFPDLVVDYMKTQHM